jgi:tRNA modification GTPase
VGRPNVGKSSLLNQLAGEDLAIVTPIAGTTRDAVQSPVEIDGIPLTIIDTAGLRATDDPIETIGIERTWAAVARADLALVLIDAVAGDEIAEADAAILSQLPAALPRVVLHNKIDLAGIGAKVATRSSDGHAEGSREERHVYLSAKTGEGVALLKREILALAGVHEDMEDTFLARARHLDALRSAAGHLDRARAHFDETKPPLELAAEDLRAAHTALSAITGEFTADDLLGAIFSRFCIGK